jgi:hypothetical protein
MSTPTPAARFFADTDLVRAELAGRTRPGAGMEVRFLVADYTPPVEVPEGSMDLLTFLFTGPTWEHARRYLRPVGNCWPTQLRRRQPRRPRRDHVPDCRWLSRTIGTATAGWSPTGSRST